MPALRALVLVPLLALAAVAGEPAPEAARVVTGNTAFACDLYGRLSGGDGNLFLSPYSISACLGMTRAGAAGDTAAQMDEVFHFPSSGLGEGFQALDAALQAPLVRDGYDRDAKEIPAYEIAVANRLFGQQGYAFKPAFLAQMKTSYGAGLEQLDIRSDSGRGPVQDQRVGRGADPRQDQGSAASGHARAGHAPRACERDLLQELVAGGVQGAQHAGRRVPPGGRERRGRPPHAAHRSLPLPRRRAGAGA